jgi:hypothetical protein
MLFGKKTRRITKLLIVEDEPLVAFDTEHFLRDEAFEIVATVDRVADAMVVIRDTGEIDLMLVDVNLADGSGLDVARAAQEAGIPVMFVTGECQAPWPSRASTSPMRSARCSPRSGPLRGYWTASRRNGCPPGSGCSRRRKQGFILGAAGLGSAA